ncbi:MAG: hypothetical protein V5A34_04085 [Halapricum sp.]
MFPKCRKYGYAWLALNGVFYAVAPRLALKMSSRMLSMGFENAEELEPKKWYANSTRAVGVGMIAAGLTGIVLEGSSGDESDPESIESETDAGNDGAAA